MFARHYLKPGTPEYESYYRDHPEHEKPDARTRARPGLSSKTSKYPDPLAFAAAETGVQGHRSPARHGRR